eukprot:TRINITY_DN2750_c0_g1_i1.p1 TRINITY_DN2750_c0_g1~~TRINITY_DN2750_c0_g1_i1.p1  ORF type:complete len:135 (-),score=23.37 TRINITY_DN2750_c0_g1_i1:221-625(-)
MSNDNNNLKKYIYNSPLDVPFLCFDEEILMSVIEDLPIQSKIPKALNDNGIYPVLNFKLLSKLSGIYGFNIEDVKCISYPLKPHRSSDEFVSLIDKICDELDRYFADDSDCIYAFYGDSYSSTFSSSDLYAKYT